MSAVSKGGNALDSPTRNTILSMMRDFKLVRSLNGVSEALQVRKSSEVREGKEFIERRVRKWHPLLIRRVSNFVRRDRKLILPNCEAGISSARRFVNWVYIREFWWSDSFEYWETWDSEGDQGSVHLQSIKKWDLNRGIRLGQRPCRDIAMLISRCVSTRKEERRSSLSVWYVTRNAVSVGAVVSDQSNYLSDANFTRRRNWYQSGKIDKI